MSEKKSKKDEITEERPKKTAKKTNTAKKSAKSSSKSKKTAQKKSQKTASKKEQVKVEDPKKNIGFDRIDELIDEKDKKLIVKEKFHVEPQAFQMRVDEKAKKYRGRVKIKGFRQGKVPLDFLKKYFAKELNDEVTEEFIKDKLREILTTKENLAVYPSIGEVDYSPEKGLSFTIAYEILPDFELKNYLQVEVEKVEEPDYEKLIDVEIERLRTDTSTLEPIEKGKKIEDENVFVEVEVQLRNLETGKWLKKFKYPVTYLKNINVLNLKENIIGMSVGEEKIYRTKTDENFPIKAVSGKDVEVRIKLLSASKVILPEVNDDFAKSLGEYSSLEELKSKIKSAIKEKFEKDKPYALGEKVLLKLSEELDFPIPPSYILDEVRYIVEKNPSMSAYEAVKEARNVVKSRMIVKKIAEIEKIEASKEDIENFAEREGKKYGLSKEQYLAYLRPEDIERIRNMTVIKKVVEFLGKNAKVM